jgi:peptide/nickel transport system substrate-binding protein
MLVEVRQKSRSKKELVLMKLWKQWRPALLAVAFALAIALATCNSPSTNQASKNPSPPASPVAAPQRTLVFGSVGAPVNLEPGNITDNNSTYVQTQIYDRLVAFKPGTTDLEPSLASEWNAADGGKVWTFKLRSGVKFHDGTDFDAEAVKFNVERWWNPNSEFGYRDAGKTYQIWAQLFGGFKGTPDSILQDVVTQGKDTIKFVLKQPFAAFADAIGSGYFGIASPAAIKKAGARYGTPSSIAVGTGAFFFQEWHTGDRIVLTKNPNYWKQGLPKSEQLIFRFVTDPSARLAQIRAGTLDLTAELSPDQLKEVHQDPNVEAVFRPSLNVGYLALNTAYQPFSKPEVRQAIAEAIQKKEIVKAFWGEFATYDPHFLPPRLKAFWSQNVNNYQYDPHKAKQLLTQAGYPNGFDLQLWYMPVSRPYFPTPKPIAEAIAADLESVGIRVSLQTKDWTAYLADRNKPPGFQAFMLGWTGDYGEPDDFYYPHFGPGSTADIGNWKNDQVFKLLAQGRAASNKTSRVKIYQQVGDILNKLMLRIPIVHSQPLLAKRKNVLGWTPSPVGFEPLESVTKS